MSLSDAEVKKQIQHMVSFMEQEAGEKANEIAVKAEEEFNIEKGRILQAEKQKIDSTYLKKEKQIETQRKIFSSNQKNKGRLEILERQSNHMATIVDEAKAKLAEIPKDAAKYKALLTNLILDGLYLVLEGKATVHCRKEDESTAKGAAEDAAKQYEAKIGSPCAVDIVGDLSGTIGGVTIASADNSIVVDQTLEERLDIVAFDVLPDFRMTLYGPSETRMHHD